MRKLWQIVVKTSPNESNILWMDTSRNKLKNMLFGKWFLLAIAPQIFAASYKLCNIAVWLYGCKKKKRWHLVTFGFFFCFLGFPFLAFFVAFLFFLFIFLNRFSIFFTVFLFLIFLKHISIFSVHNVHFSYTRVTFFW